MNDSHISPPYLPADEDIAEQLVAFLLRCADARLRNINPRLMSELTAKKILNGLKRSGYILVKQADNQEPEVTLPHGQLYLL